MKKKLISLMLVLVLMVCIATVPSMADTSENSTFAYLMYADASWTNQYWAQTTAVSRRLKQTSPDRVNTRSALILQERKRAWQAV